MFLGYAAAMTTMRFEPLALQIAKTVSVDRLLGADRLSGMPDRGADDAALPSDVEEFMSCYMRVVAAAWQLLGAPQFQRLAQLYERFEAEFAPGGPPMSPVYDSYASQHILGEVPHGVANETPYTVLARLTCGRPRYERLHGMARALADSYLDLFRVTAVDGLSAELEPIRGGDSLSVRLTGPFLRGGDRMLARVVPYGAGLFIADSPYLLRATEADWLEYLARASGSEPKATPKSDERAGGRAIPKLTSKQRARLRQRAATPHQGSGTAVVRHLKHGRSERYWLDYIMDGYAGERRGIVYLAGVPDRPETLPHHVDYQPITAGAVMEDSEPPPSAPGELGGMPALRAKLLAIADREGIPARVEGELRGGAEQQGLAAAEVQPGEAYLLAAYQTLGAHSRHGLTALEHLERERVLDAEERSLVESLKRGGFSLLRVDRIDLDEGLGVLDVLRRKKLRISERSATRQLALGDLVAGWLCEDERGTLTLEGGVMHVRSLMAPFVIDLAKRLRDATRQQLPGADWRARAAELPPQLILGLRAIRSRAAMPELCNTSGDALQLARGRYALRDPQRVREALAAHFMSADGHTFAWQSSAGTLLATFELGKDALVVRVNSLERLAAAKARLEALLGDAIAPSLDVLDGDLQAELRASSARAPSAPSEPLELPPELAQQVQAMLIQRIAGMLDQPIEMFKGKTLRQIARSKSTRPDAISWLREQQRILELNPQLKGVDMRPLWAELGLDYQGLETDG